MKRRHNILDELIGTKEFHFELDGEQYVAQYAVTIFPEDKFFPMFQSTFSLFREGKDCELKYQKYIIAGFKEAIKETKKHFKERVLDILLGKKCNEKVCMKVKSTDLNDPNFKIRHSHYLSEECLQLAILNKNDIPVAVINDTGIKTLPGYQAIQIPNTKGMREEYPIFDVNARKHKFRSIKNRNH